MKTASRILVALLVVGLACGLILWAFSIQVPQPSGHDYSVTVSGVEDPSGNVVYSGTGYQCIQYALACTPVGGTVHLEAGTYTIPDGFNVNRSLVGSGNDTKLVADGSNERSLMTISNADGSSLSGVTVSNMQLDGQGAKFPNAQFGGIMTVGVSNCTLENLYVHDFPYSQGIEFQASSYNSIRNCVIANIGYGNQYGSGICSGNMTRGVSSAFNVVEHCTITGCSFTGIDWEPGNDNVVRDTTISGLTSWSGNTVGISIWNIDGWPASSNNRYYNVSIDHAGVGVDSEAVTGTVFEGCTFTGSSSAAIYAAGCSGWKVNSCTIKTNGGHGVFFDNGNANTVTGCHIEDAKRGYNYGVQMTSDAANLSQGNVVSGNQISYMDRAIYFGSYTTSSMVSNNTEVGCRYADSIPGTPNTVIGNVRESTADW
ncbi:MAG: right-handed parallel beta-helix repeat-containing protein [Methanomassiliicoccus sp.]|nr:right-handed parallel beta-helix repeat-containing protein [Methanomassiliicoccus sp.]